ncbi:MAG: hypothetical protein AAF490_02675 [Chloroflexota bacterium]
MIDIESIQSAFNNIITRLIEFGPTFLTSVLILGVGWLLSRIVSNIVIRVSDRVGLEGLLERTGVRAGLDRAQIKQTGGQLLGRLLFWIIFLNFFLIGLENMGLNAAVQPLRDLIGFLPRIIAALATLTAGVLLAQFLGKAAQAAMSGMGVEFHEEVGQGVNILLIIMVVTVVLEQVGIDADILTSIFVNVISLIIAGLALAFGLGGRDVARNVLAGYYAREQYEPGDLIVINGDEGFLEGIGTLNAEIRVGEDVLIVPNTRLTATAVKIREIADNNDASLEESSK